TPGPSGSGGSAPEAEPSRSAPSSRWSGGRGEERARLHARRDAHRARHLRHRDERPDGALRPGNERRVRPEQPLPGATGSATRARQDPARGALRERRQRLERDVGDADAAVVLPDRERLRDVVHGLARIEPLRPLPQDRRRLRLDRRALGRLPDERERLLLRRPEHDEPGEAERRLPRQREAVALGRHVRAQGRHRAAEQPAAVRVRLLERLRRYERGFVLPLALGILVVLSISVTTAIYYTTQNQRSSGYSKGKQVALTLAEAGLNNTMAVLNLPTNNSLHQNILPACTNNAQSNWNKTTLDGGHVIWCGDLDLSASAWSVTAIGTVRN